MVEIISLHGQIKVSCLQWITEWVKNIMDMEVELE